MKLATYSSVMKAAFPERFITKAEADAFGQYIARLQAEAVAAGWTPEYVATLDSKDRKK